MGWSQEDFDKRMRNIARSQSEIVFRREWFYGDDNPGCLDETRSFGDIPKDENGEDISLLKVLGFDPASGKKSVFAAYPTWQLLGFPTWGDPDTSTRYLIDAYRLKSGVEELLDVLLDGNSTIPHPGFHKKYKYDICVVEQNGFANLDDHPCAPPAGEEPGIVFRPHRNAAQ